LRQPLLAALRLRQAGRFPFFVLFGFILMSGFILREFRAAARPTLPTAAK
jgi:hypothetical protein